LSIRLSIRFDNRVNVCIHDTTGCQTHRLSNWFDNRLYRVYKHSIGCQTRLTTGLTNGCIVYTASCQAGCITRFDNRLYRVYEHSTGCQTGLTTGCQTGLTTGLTTGWMFVYTIQPVVKPVVQPVVYRVNGVLKPDMHYSKYGPLWPVFRACIYARIFDIRTSVCTGVKQECQHPLTGQRAANFRLSFL